MRRLAIFFLLLCFVVTSSNSSMQMFSFEQGKAHTENYNLDHVLNSLPVDICFTCEKHKGSLTSSRNHGHSHVILLNSVARNKGDIITYLNNPIPISVTFARQCYLFSLIPTNTSPPPSIVKFLSAKTLYLQKSTVLLI